MGQSKLRSLVESAILVPLVMPPVAVGLILLHLLSPDSFLGQMYESLFGTTIVLSWHAAVIAVAVVSFPLFVRTAHGAFKDVPNRYKNMAATLGYGPLKVFWTITLPLAYRGVLNGFLLAFARGLGEFGATVLVAGIIPGQTETIALGIYDRIQTGRDGEAWGLVAIAVFLALCVLALSQWIQNRKPQYQRGRA
jgi:molybdate transport system permease protein